MSGKSRANVFEIANIASIKTAGIEEFPNISEELASHKSSASVSAHQINNISGLDYALSNKAAVNHTHTIANVTGLQGVLDSKANKSLTTQVITVVTGVDFANQTVTTAEINVVDGIIIEIN